MDSKNTQTNEPSMANVKPLRTYYTLFETMRDIISPKLGAYILGQNAALRYERTISYVSKTEEPIV